MKKFLAFLLIVSWLLYFSVVGPFLISARDTFLVVVGMLLPSFLVFLTFHFIKRNFYK